MNGIPAGIPPSRVPSTIPRRSREFGISPSTVIVVLIFAATVLKAVEFFVCR